MARSFNGSSDQIVVGNNSVLFPASITVSAWLLITSVPSGYATAVDAEDSTNTGSVYSISTHGTTNQLAYYFGAGSNPVAIDPGSHTLTTGAWTHVLVSYDSTSGVLAAYVNGASDGTSTGSGSLPTSTKPLSFGANLAAGRNWNGNLADVAIWNTAVSAGEIAALVAGARPYTIRPATLIGWWPLDGLQSPEPDLSGNANNGTLTGTALAFGPPIAMFTPRWPQWLQFVPPPVFFQPVGVSMYMI